MKDEIEQHRTWAVQRFLSGEKPESICASLGRSRAWLYKWVKRYGEGDASWCEDRSRRPRETPNRTSSDIEEIVKRVRLTLEKSDQFCGAQAILWEWKICRSRRCPRCERSIGFSFGMTCASPDRRVRAERNTVSSIAVTVAQPNPSGRFGWPLLPGRAGTLLWTQCQLIWPPPVVVCTRQRPKRGAIFWTVSGKSGSVWEYRNTSRSTMPCLSSAVPDIRAAWDR